MEFCALCPGLIEWIAPSAGSTAFPRWAGDGTVEELCATAITKHELMIVPGSMFAVSGSHFRVGLGRDNFPQALAVFQELIFKD
jgi:aspartate/methionine/tyrosine aminotransferase